MTLLLKSSSSTTVCSKISQKFRGSMGGVFDVGAQQAVGQVSVVEVSVEPFG